MDQQDTRHQDLINEIQTVQASSLQEPPPSSPPEPAPQTRQQLSTPPQRQLHALDLVEIRTLVAQHLSRPELTRCTLVSRQWSFYFLPFYWRKISISSFKTVPLDKLGTIAKYGSHIRILHAGCIEKTSVFNQPSISQLLCLEVSTLGKADSEDKGRGCVTEVIVRNRATLKELNWRCFGRDYTWGHQQPFRLYARLFDNSLARSSQTRFLNLTTMILANWSISKLDFVRILMACPALRDVVFDATEHVKQSDIKSVRPSPDTSPNAGADDKDRDLLANDPSPSMWSFQHRRVESITFEGNVLPNFLQHLPNLRRLALQGLNTNGLRSIPDELRVRPYLCPYLQELVMNTTLNPREASRFLDIIESVPSFTTQDASPVHLPIKSFLNTRSDLVNPPATGLRLFEGRVPFSVIDNFFELILSRHSATIEVVSLEDNMDRGDAFRFNIWRVLETCPRLTTFEVPYSLTGAYQFASRLAMAPLFPPTSHHITGSNLTTNTNTMGTAALNPGSGFGASAAGGALSSSPVVHLARPYEPIYDWVCKDMRRLWIRIKDMDPRRPMDQIPIDLCVDRLLPPEGKRDNSKRTQSELERLILEMLSGLERLEELNIGSGWYLLMKKPRAR
ncbi:hypothetical protein BGW38_000356 [Lunasporangiospora selenospora]|uniref:F-box domain-containing protein n=1 Tax=Lunasporangiospora selenospora TaxID=979761 RepID=A0A9P6FVT4_9FUNG|nr:hypothetical protein BGW38_000356 [Lunasporangiospora selenospora]